jgi:hypothetical protein
MVLTAYVVLSPVTGLFCHRRLRIKVLSAPGRADKTSANLTPASGRQDHTILPSATTSLVGVLLIAHKSFDPPCDPIARKTLLRPPHPAPTSVTIAIRPSVWDGMAGVVDVIWGEWKQEYFCKGDSTRQLTNRPTGKSLHGGERKVLSCPGRGAASFTLLRRAGTHSRASGTMDPGSAAHHAASAARCAASGERLERR